MKLPPLKFNMYSLASRSTSIIHRGLRAESSSQEPCSTKLEEPSQTTETEPVVIKEKTFLASDFDDFPSEDEPTHHELQKKANVEGWEQLRSRLLSVATECNAMPLGQLCLLCPNLANVRCQECGPSIFYCSKCFSSYHKSANFFHVAEKWEVILIM